jgi:hypothetical protein
LPAHDLHTIWAKEVTEARLEVGRALAADIEKDRAEIFKELAGSPRRISQKWNAE